LRPDWFSWGTFGVLLVSSILPVGVRHCEANCGARTCTHSLHSYLTLLSHGASVLSAGWPRATWRLTLARIHYARTCRSRTCPHASRSYLTLVAMGHQYSPRCCSASSTALRDRHGTRIGPARTRTGAGAARLVRSAATAAGEESRRARVSGSGAGRRWGDTTLMTTLPTTFSRCHSVSLAAESPAKSTGRRLREASVSQLGNRHVWGRVA
jgi:hypothetical protein